MPEGLVRGLAPIDIFGLNNKSIVERHGDDQTAQSFHRVLPWKSCPLKVSTRRN